MSRERITAASAIVDEAREVREEAIEAAIVADDRHRAQAVETLARAHRTYHTALTLWELLANGQAD